MDKKENFNRQCFACRQPININRYSNNDILYFDKHYYHKECFENMNYVKKKCYCCKSNNDEIIITNESDTGNCILFDKHYYHLDCFIAMCNEKNTKKWKNALANLDVLKKYTYEQILILIDNKREKYGNIELLEEKANIMIDRYFEESDVDMLIKELYDVTKINSAVWNKLSRIYNGEIQGMDNGIPPLHLYDMWERKIGYLNKIANNNITKGKEMSKTERILYDLSVLVNKYDSYLEWANKQRILECDKEIIHSTDVVSKIDISNLEKNNKEIKNDDDIDNILDEIFG